MTIPQNSKERIRQKALELGFAACGFAKLKALDTHQDGFDAFLQLGYQGGMSWLERNLDLRLDPRKLVPGVKTIISLIAPYYHPYPEAPKGKPKISRYALGEDYHNVLKKRGKELLRFLQREFPGTQGRVFTDSAPIMEREWARLAGLGWIGKNGCLIHGKEGSWFFIAELLVNLKISGDEPFVSDFCGHCTRCIDACPTEALLGDGKIEAKKCISYLTIEHKSEIPENFKGKWNDWIFGCDICQEVCPWNKTANPPGLDPFKPSSQFQNLEGETFKSLSEDEFDQKFSNSPLKRAGLELLKRNIDFVFDPSWYKSDTI